MRSTSVSHTRRELLFGMAGAALAIPQPRNRLYNPLLAVHTSIWQAEAALRNRRLADIQEEAFLRMERAGYRRIELISEFLEPDLRAHTLDLLRKHNLQATIIAVDGPLWEKAAAEDSRQRVLEIARLMQGWDTRFIDFHPTAKPAGAPRTADDLYTEAYQLNRMGQELAQIGMRLMAGHGVAEMQDDARDWRYMASHTETRRVSFCIDVDCVARAGMRPVTMLDAAGPRLHSLLLRNPREGTHQELLREGDINMTTIAQFLRASSYDGYLVVDLVRDPAVQREYGLTEALSRSRWYMQEVFGSRPGNPPVDMGPHVRERKRG